MLSICSLCVFCVGGGVGGFVHQHSNIVVNAIMLLCASVSRVSGFCRTLTEIIGDQVQFKYQSVLDVYLLDTICER